MEQAQDLANELGLTYVETSAKSSANVDDAFFKLAQQVKDHLVEQGITSNAPSSSTSQSLNAKAGAGTFNVGSVTGKQGGCC